MEDRFSGRGSHAFQWSRGWLWLIAGIALSVFALLVAPRLSAVYWLYWGSDSFKRIFYEHIGLSDAWSSTFAITLSFFYALAMVHLVGRTTWQVLAGRTDPRKTGIVFVCYVIAFAFAPLIEGLAATWENPDQCFNQRTGEAIKWYVVMGGGEIALYDSEGYDKFGTKKLPATNTICEIFHRQRAGDRPNKITKNPRQIEFFDSITRAPVVWYSQTSGNINLYDAPGFDPITSDALLPVTPNIVTEVRAVSEKSSPQPAPPVIASPPAKPNSTSGPSENPTLPSSKFQNPSISNAFDFRVCNHAIVSTSIAVMGREISSANDEVVKGWLKVDPGECRPGGRFIKGDFLVTARAPGLQWGARWISLCVESGSFRKIHDSSRQCTPGEFLVAFNKVNVAIDSWTWNLQ